jgi:hypothetical protein
VPTEGFVLNKGVGGARQSYGWNTRNEYIRVYDPRNFEFEISVANLLFILRECDCSKGKGLEGQFVYAWEGTQLVLLPALSEDFKTSSKFTELQGKKVSSKELVPGYTYGTKKQERLVYLGRFDYFYFKDKDSNKYHHEYGIQTSIKKYVFWSDKSKYGYDNNGHYVYMDVVKNIAEVVFDAPRSDLQSLIRGYQNSVHGSKVFCLEIGASLKDKKEWYVKQDDSSFFLCENINTRPPYGSKESPTLEYVRLNRNIFLKEGVLTQDYLYDRISTKSGQLPPSIQKDKSGWCGNRTDYNIFPWHEPVKNELYVVMESGERFVFQKYELFSKG